VVAAQNNNYSHQPLLGGKKAIAWHILLVDVDNAEKKCLHMLS